MLKIMDRRDKFDLSLDEKAIQQIETYEIKSMPHYHEVTIKFVVDIDDLEVIIAD